MTKKSASITEIDLRPYQTHVIFEGDQTLDSTLLGRLLKDLPKIINDGVEERDELCEIFRSSPPRLLQPEYIAWVAYRRRIPARWSIGPNAPKDLENHLVVLVARSNLLSVVATDKSLVSKLSRGGGAGAWSDLNRIRFGRLERALVTGATRTLWLSGIHRSVPTKPDSKVLIGPDVEASLDALGDQSYQYTSTRCEGPKKLPTSFVGVTPRMGKVWLGPSTDWEVFLATSRRLLELIEHGGSTKETPYPVLARVENSLKDVKDAFDVSLAAPEYLYDEDPALVEELEKLLQNATWTVKGEKEGPNCTVAFTIHGETFEYKIDVNASAEETKLTVTPLQTTENQTAQKLADFCGRPDLLKIFYESLHTYSDGQLFEVKTRPFPFPLTAEDFSGYTVSLEKPYPEGKTEGTDLSRIGEAGEPSLFSWVFRKFKKGWLWCDDGSGEIADFIHLDPDKSELTLIHVKAAQSKSPNRGISVSAYEVVCSQALKNLRYTERRELEKPLRDKMKKEATIVRGWHNGAELSSKSPNLWSAIAKVRYSELKRKIIVVQPHVRKSQIPQDLVAETRATKQAQLLFTLLHGVSADIKRYEVEFEVIVDK